MEEESWHKLDPLASKQVEMDFLRDFGDTFMDFEPSKSTAVPDISDTVFKLSCLSENIETRFDCDDLLSVLSPSEPDVDLGLGLDSVEPLRQDCMWSGLVPSEEREPGQEVSVFHTPLQSDFETSDLDESFSDLESSSSPSPETGVVSVTTQRVPDNVPDKHSVLLDHMYNDHCYISSSASSAPSKPPVAGEKHSGYTVKSTKENNRITVKRKQPGNKTNIVKLYQKQAKSGTKGSGSAKFKFQMKFLSPSSTSTLAPLGLGRSASARRRTAVKNAFCPTPAKTIEIKDVKEADKVKDIRDLHNSMERQRRIDLKRAFDCLKICVPELAESDKASKLMILDKAANFCQTLKKKELTLNAEKERHRRRQFHLKKKLSLLEYKTPTKSLLLPTNRRLI